MNMGRGIIGGALGGLIGAVIWAGISYFTGYEIGWIAWGVGGMVGLGYFPAGIDSWSRAVDTSADGSVVVGSTSSASGQQAFRWTSDDGMGKSAITSYPRLVRNARPLLPTVISLTSCLS